MENNIEVIVNAGPTIVDSDQKLIKYLTVGVKYSTGVILDDNLEEKNKAGIVQGVIAGIEQLKIQNPTMEEMLEFTDEFFEYVKNNDTKIEIIRVSRDDYIKDYNDKKLKSLKITHVLYTVDDDSKNRLFDLIVKELYYEFGMAVIDIYSILLTPKIYTIIDGIPIEQRGIIIRIKNKEI